MKVLVAVDESKYSEYSELVVRYVREVAWAKGTTFIVLSVAAPVLSGVAESAAPDPVAELMRLQRGYHREIAERAASQLREAELRAEPRMMPGDPRDVLTDTARSERVDLIVVGSHGRTGLKKLLLGSVASHVVTHAPCSVLVVRKGVSRNG